MPISSYTFNINPINIPLALSLPNHTAIFNTWPKATLRTNVNLPQYIRAVKPIDDVGFTNNKELLGPTLHVIEGDRLQVNLTNKLPASGLSLHFHGFKMRNALEYDGVVGVTQCALSPDESFLYDFTVDEIPGTYWYHTHSGAVGINAYNAIKGPIIVHPKDSLKRYPELFDSSFQLGYDEQLSYGDERILFFSDGFLASASQQQVYNMGGLTPPISKDENGFSVGTTNFDFGMCNGKLREVVNVEPGKTYKMRLINGAQHFAFRISIDSISMRVIAADSEPVQSVEVNEVILHGGERFDVLITIPNDYIGGKRLWIRADTLESTKQGFQNGVRAILNVISDNSDHTNVKDPADSIISPREGIKERHTINCYSRYERENAVGDGNCLPITDLKRNPEAGKEQSILNSSFHFIDFEFSAPPQFAHFVRIDHGLWLQHENPTRSMLHNHFRYDIHAHPNTAILNVPTFSSIILVWRNKSLMDHPMHLHGYKMEILAVALPKRERDCTLSSCKLNDEFDMDKLAELDKTPIHTSVLKDTFILPAGGAVVTRIQTLEPAVWLAHCHMDIHRDDGMAFILNIGNYQAPSNSSWLPEDYPSCDTPFLQTNQEHPACNCYINNDAVLGKALTKDHMCSRYFLCYHELGQAANLDSYKSTGFQISSKYKTSAWVFGLVIAGIVFFVTFVWCVLIPRYIRKDTKRTVSSNAVPKRQDSMRKSITAHFTWDQKGYQPGAINALRVFEVTGLAFLTGIIFYDVGNDSSAMGISEKYSLLFFSITLWTFTRMYPAVANYNAWYKKMRDLKIAQFSDIFIWCFSRMFVIIISEAWWPFVHCFVTYSLAGMFQQLSSIIVMSCFLALNTICYVSIGAAFGVVFNFVPLGMCMSTIVSQTSLVAAGFYTKLIPGLSWIRYTSPVFWTFRGITKTALHWSDTYTCLKGEAEIGANQCYLEYFPGIDALKRRGINVATFNDASSGSVYFEALMLCALFLTWQVIIFLICYVSIQYERNLENNKSNAQDDSVESDLTGHTLSPTDHSRFTLQTSLE